MKWEIDNICISIVICISFFVYTQLNRLNMKNDLTERYVTGILEYTKYH